MENCWSIEETALQGIMARLQNIDGAAAAAAFKPSEVRQTGYGVSNGVATLQLVGVMEKHLTWLGRILGGTSSAELRDQFRQAAADPYVKSIALRIDSPGGSLRGCGDLRDEVARVNASKPVHAFIEDVGASAAYQVASAARSISASRHAAVGGIGVYALLYDYSEAAKAAGIKAVLIKYGEHKGAGAPGTPITDSQLAEFQRTVDAWGAVFVADVAAGRRMSEATARKLADGRIHLGDQARQLGLVDRVESWDSFVSRVGAEASPQPATKPKPAAETWQAAVKAEAEALIAQGWSAAAAWAEAPIRADRKNPGLRSTVLAQGCINRGQLNQAAELLEIAADRA